MNTQVLSPETLPALNWNNQPVIMTNLLAEIYGTAIDNIKMNFNNNKDRFIENVHYYLLKGADLKAFKLQVNDIYPQISNMTRSLYLWTERGTVRHAKILDTDNAWLVQDRLEDCYFAKNALVQYNPEPPTKKALPNGLTTEQQDCIKAMVKVRVEVLPKEQQAKGTITCWSALKAKFGYRKPETYKSIKPEDYTTALSLLARLQLDGEPEQVVMTQAELLAHDEQVASEAVKRVQGELVEPPKYNSITLALPPLPKGEKVKRFFVTQYDNEVKWGVIKEGYYFDKAELQQMTMQQFSHLVA